LWRGGIVNRQPVFRRVQTGPVPEFEPSRLSPPCLCLIPNSCFPGFHIQNLEKVHVELRKTGTNADPHQFSVPEFQHSRLSTPLNHTLRRFVVGDQAKLNGSQGPAEMIVPLKLPEPEESIGPTKGLGLELERETRDRPQRDSG